MGGKLFDHLETLITHIFICRVLQYDRIRCFAFLNAVTNKTLEVAWVTLLLLC